MIFRYFDFSTLSVASVTTVATAATAAVADNPSLVWIGSIVLTGLVTGIVTHLTSRASNKSLIATAEKTKEETNALILQNTQTLLQLKGEEIKLYREKIDTLERTVERLEFRIGELTNGIAELTEENTSLRRLLSRRLRTLFTADGEVELIFHPADAEKSSESTTTGTPVTGRDEDDSHQ